MFEKKNHAKRLLEAEDLIAHALMLSEGMTVAYNGMKDKLYIDMADGAFALMAHALNTAYEIISDEGVEFVKEHDLNYPLDKPTDEPREYSPDFVKDVATTAYLNGYLAQLKGGERK